MLLRPSLCALLIVSFYPTLIIRKCQITTMLLSCVTQHHTQRVVSGTPRAALFLSLRGFAIADSSSVYYYDSHRYNIQTSLLSALGLSTLKPDTRSQSLLLKVFNFIFVFCQDLRVLYLITANSHAIPVRRSPNGLQNHKNYF